jgi:hypothetical protein
LTTPKLLVIAFLGLGRAAIAADANFYVSLRYEVDGSARRCWDEAEFRRNVAQWEGYDPFRPKASATVSIRVGGSGQTLDGQIEWRNADGSDMGERHFGAYESDCAGLLKEMSFAVAFQIDLMRPGKQAGTAHAPSEEVSAPPAASSPEAGKTAAAAPPAPVLRAEPRPTVQAPAGQTATVTTQDAGSAAWPMWAGVGTSLAWGISPAITGEASLFVGARRKNLSMEVGAQASLPSTTRQWDLSGFRQSLIGAQLSICGNRGASSACVLGRAGEVRVSGVGVDQPRSPSAFVAQAGLRLAAALRIGGLWYAASHIDLLGLITPYTVNLNQVGVWEMPRLGVLAGIDVSARFR